MNKMVNQFARTIILAGASVMYGETHYLWRAVDHEGEVLETFVSKR
jgi:hypothetical protein